MMVKSPVQNGSFKRDVVVHPNNIDNAFCGIQILHFLTSNDRKSSSINILPLYLQ